MSGGAFRPVTLPYKPLFRRPGRLWKGKTTLSFAKTSFCLVAYFGVKTVMTWAVSSDCWRYRRMRKTVGVMIFVGELSSSVLVWFFFELFRRSSLAQCQGYGCSLTGTWSGFSSLVGSFQHSRRLFNTPGFWTASCWIEEATLEVGIAWDCRE